jgi:hypothetical protein
LHAAYVIPGDIENASAVVADLADSRQPIWDRTAVSAGEAPDTIIVQLLIKLALADVSIENVFQSSHSSDIRGFSPHGFSFYYNASMQAWECQHNRYRGIPRSGGFDA